MRDVEAADRAYALDWAGRLQQKFALALVTGVANCVGVIAAIGGIDPSTALARGLWWSAFAVSVLIWTCGLLFVGFARRWLSRFGSPCSERAGAATDTCRIEGRP